MQIKIIVREIVIGYQKHCYYRRSLEDYWENLRYDICSGKLDIAARNP